MHRQKHVESADIVVRSIAAQRGGLMAVSLWGTCRLRCQTNRDDSPAASAIRALQQQRHYFSCMASTTASRRMTCAPLSLASSTKSVPATQSGDSGTSPFHDGQERNGYSLMSDVTPRKSQGVRPRGASRIGGRPGVITTRRGHQGRKGEGSLGRPSQPRSRSWRDKGCPQEVRGCRYTQKHAIS